MEDTISFSFKEGFEQFRSVLLAMAELKQMAAVMMTPDGGANVDRPPVISFLVFDRRRCKILFVFTSSSLSSERTEQRVGIHFDSLRAHWANVTAVPDMVSFTSIGNRLDMKLDFFDDAGSRRHVPNCSGTYVGGSHIKEFPPCSFPIWVSPKYRTDYTVTAQVTGLKTDKVPPPGFQFKVVFDTFLHNVRFETPLGTIVSKFTLWDVNHGPGVEFPFVLSKFSFEQTSYSALSAILRTAAETLICATQSGQLAIQCTLYNKHGVVTTVLQPH